VQDPRWLTWFFATGIKTLHMWALRTFVVFFAACTGLAAYGWATDKIALQGECTTYTVRCVGGAWQDNQCSGRLESAERFRFRALTSHREVLFWTVGSAQPSGKFTDCVIEDRRNWACNANAEAARTITLQMVHGQPTRDSSGTTMAFHSVDKWRWWLLRLGIPLSGTGR